MKLHDFKSAWDTTAPTTSRPRAWYDSSDEKLKAAVARLRWLSTKEKAFRTGAVFKSQRAAVALALLLCMLVLSTTSAPWPVVLAAPLVMYALLYAAGLAIVRHLRMRHGRKLLRGGFGHAIMWDFEPAWETLNSALQAYELTLDGFFSRQSLNRTVTPIIAKYLSDTGVARGVLRQHGWFIPAGSDSLAKLHAAATQAAMAMVLARGLYFSTARR